VLVPPILRQLVIDARERHHPPSDHLLVYQTATSQDDLIEILKSIGDRRFIVYGLNRDEVHDNVTARSFSEEGFVRELATARAVITNGGFSLISEAVFLNRPVCSFPLDGQFEQFVNGAEVERLGYGRRFSTFSADAVKAFLYDLGAFTATVAGYRQDGNRQLFGALDQFLDDVAAKRLPDDE
jgi:uncharacterized protein (TIGR00661 family)